jgi:2-methylcitrate dehydratase PrpD
MQASLDLCGRLADLRYESLPVSARQAASHVLLDAAGVMLGASGLAAEIQPFVTVAAAQGQGRSAILGTGRQTSAAMAALANGAMAHALDFEDAFDRAPGHPNASLVPALLALAQAEGPVSGERFVAALVAGCEMSCRMALALRRPMEAGGWYPPPMLAAFGAAAGAAHLLGLNAVQMRDALSLTLCSTVMPGEIKHSARTVIRAVREAFPAQAAVLAALLAHEGVSGFEAPLEGKAGFYALYAGGQFDADVLIAVPTQDFSIAELTFKPWPSCRGTHAAIELALALRQTHGFASEDIRAIEVDHDPIQTMLTQPLDRKRAPQTSIDARFSIPWCIALALHDGAVTIDSFTPARLADPAVQTLAARVTPRETPSGAWQPGSGGRVAIGLADGRTVTSEVGNALGCPARPLGEAALVAKFIDCAGRAAVPPRDPAELARRILGVASRDDVGALLA